MSRWFWDDLSNKKNSIFFKFWAFLGENSNFAEILHTTWVDSAIYEFERFLWQILNFARNVIEKPFFDLFLPKKQIFSSFGAISHKFSE